MAKTMGGKWVAKKPKQEMIILNWNHAMVLYGRLYIIDSN